MWSVVLVIKGGQIKVIRLGSLRIKNRFTIMLKERQKKRQMKTALICGILLWHIGSIL